MSELEHLPEEEQEHPKPYQWKEIAVMASAIICYLLSARMTYTTATEEKKAKLGRDLVTGDYQGILLKAIAVAFLGGSACGILQAFGQHVNNPQHERSWRFFFGLVINIVPACLARTIELNGHHSYVLCLFAVAVMMNLKFCAWRNGEVDDSFSIWISTITLLLLNGCIQYYITHHKEVGIAHGLATLSGCLLVCNMIIRYFMGVFRDITSIFKRSPPPSTVQQANPPPPPPPPPFQPGLRRRADQQEHPKLYKWKEIAVMASAIICYLPSALMTYTTATEEKKAKLGRDLVTGDYHGIRLKAIAVAFLGGSACGILHAFGQHVNNPQHERSWRFFFGLVINIVPACLARTIELNGHHSYVLCLFAVAVMMNLKFCAWRNGEVDDSFSIWISNITLLLLNGCIQYYVTGHKEVAIAHGLATLSGCLLVCNTIIRYFMGVFRDIISIFKRSRPSPVQLAIPPTSPPLMPALQPGLRHRG